MGFLPSYCRISTTEWLHKVDFNQTSGKKATGDLHKDAVCCFEQILSATPTKQQPYGHILPISQTTPGRLTRYILSTIEKEKTNS